MYDHTSCIIALFLCHMFNVDIGMSRFLFSCCFSVCTGSDCLHCDGDDTVCSDCDVTGGFYLMIDQCLGETRTSD